MRVVNYLLLSILAALFFISQAQAGVTMRLMAVNPADSEQTVPIKVYLPVEVKPEDVIYKGDLDVAYDAQQGSYYVFGEFLLAPKEVLEKEIEIKDVWVIDPGEATVLRREAQDLLGAFKKTKYYERAEIIYNVVDKKLKELEEMQDLSSASPGYKISNYRNSLSLIKSVKSDLIAAKTLLSEVLPKGMARFTWGVILFIVLFLGVLGGGSFLIWQRQSKFVLEEKPQEHQEQE
ncbi:MAG: hypothetical protein WC301_05245 [Candidatus Omnitrophota bacterium]|jgi:hypothetical protein